MDRARFESLVAEVLDELPAEFAAHLANVAVVIESEPSAELLRSLGMDGRSETLFGLYQGVPLDEREAAFGNALPDQVTLFYRPLVRAFRTPERIRREVRATVIHEIGHHFGFDDATLEREGY